MSRINLTLIQTFYQVARLGSFSGAARELNLSYQSAANHVRRFEMTLKERLIESEQGAKRIRLTPYGQTLFNLLHPELDIMLDRLTRLIDTHRSSLRIGMPQAIFYFLFPDVLKQFRKRFPELEIITLERDTVLPDLIKNGQLDVCLTERLFGEPTIPQRQLGTYRLALVYPADWSVPDVNDIPGWAAGRPLITYEAGQTLRDLTLDYLASNGGSPWPVVSTSGSSSVKRCVEEGLGFSVIPDWCVKSTDDTIASIRLDHLAEVSIYFSCAAFLQSHPAVQALYEICRTCLAGPVLDPPRSSAGAALALNASNPNIQKPA